MVWDMEIITKSAEETKKFGENIANKLKGGEILALVGDLGSGKTTFVQGLSCGLGVASAITSPTFILMKDYETEENNIGKVKRLYHLDLYRLEENINSEVKNLGLGDLVGRGENIVVIEWADKAKVIMPKDTIWIEFENIGGEERRIRVHTF